MDDDGGGLPHRINSLILERARGKKGGEEYFPLPVFIR